MELESSRSVHQCLGSPWCQSAEYPDIPNGPYTPEGQPERDRAAWAEVTADTDLRTLPDRLREDWSLRWLFVQERRVGYRTSRYFSLEPFQQGAPLGPLATVQVYASDPAGAECNPRAIGGWGGSRKSHGLGCQHVKSLEPGWHQQLTLEEFLPLLPLPHHLVSYEPFSPQDRAWHEQRDRWCVKCGGYEIRRFTDEQCEYYAAAVEAANAADVQ